MAVISWMIRSVNAPQQEVSSESTGWVFFLVRTTHQTRFMPIMPVMSLIWSGMRMSELAWITNRRAKLLKAWGLSFRPDRITGRPRKHMEPNQSNLFPPNNCREYAKYYRFGVGHKITLEGSLAKISSAWQVRFGCRNVVDLYIDCIPTKERKAPTLPKLTQHPPRIQQQRALFLYQRIVKPVVVGADNHQIARRQQRR